MYHITRTTRCTCSCAPVYTGCHPHFSVARLLCYAAVHPIAIGLHGSFPTAFPKLLWQRERYLKPALRELYKKHPVCTKIRLLEIQNRIFLGRGHPHAPPLGVIVPPFANSGALLFGSRSSFLGNDPWGRISLSTVGDKCAKDNLGEILSKV